MRKGILRQLISLVYPVRCPVCSGIIDYDGDFCGKCRSKLTLYDNTDFNINNAEFFSAPFEYDRNISPAVLLLKKGIGGNAPFALANAIFHSLEKIEISDRIDFITAVPMLKTDIRKRGFNQAELIARELSHLLNIPCDFTLIEKIKSTEQQKLLTKKERKINIRDAFIIRNSEKISGKNILIIDDICTTGATLTEITAVFKANGAKKIYCACACKTPLRKETDYYD